MVEQQIKYFIKEVELIKTKDQASQFATKNRTAFENVLSKTSDKDWKWMDRFVISCIHVGSYHVMEFAEWILQKRQMELKRHPQMIKGWLAKVEEQGQHPTSENNELCSNSDYNGFMEKLTTLINRNNMMKQFQDHLVRVLLKSMETLENRLQIASVQIASHFPWGHSPKCVTAVMKKSLVILHQYPSISTKDNLSTVISSTWTNIFTDYCRNVRQVKMFLPQITEAFKFCADQDWFDDNYKEAISHEMLKIILENFLMHHTSDTVILKALLPTTVKIWRSGNEVLQRDANNVFSSAGSKAYEVLGEEMVDVFLKQYFDGDQLTLITDFEDIYPKCPEKFNVHTDRFVEFMEGQDTWLYSATLTFLWAVAKKSPESFSTKSIAIIVKTLDKKDTHALGLMSLGAIAEKRPEDIECHEAAILKCLQTVPHMAPRVAHTVVEYSKTSEEKAEKCMKILYDHMKNADYATKMHFFYHLYTIGGMYVQALSKYEGYFQKLQKTADYKNVAQGLLDIIAGRTLESISGKAAEQKSDLKKVDQRASTTKHKATSTRQTVARTTAKVKAVKVDVQKQEGRLKNVETEVQETTEKVDELDQKVLTHTPSWAADVAKLINPKAKCDWRELAVQLGYKNTDIRTWATQPNPCLSLLDEWFATHQTAEATTKVVKVLKELKRTNAVSIIEKHPAQVEKVVKEGINGEESLPSILISYDLKNQLDIQLLKTHLEMGGFPCWMSTMNTKDEADILQSVIRKARVVICCVSDNYTKAEHGSRELSTAITLGKPIIPLLLEKMHWPPPGSMGPLLSEYLFIRFYPKSEEETGSHTYWPNLKFRELLMQLRYHTVPDADGIADVYKEWWKQPEEIYKLKSKKQRRTENPHQTSQNMKSPAKLDQPEIFISYQWDKQTEVISMYKTLTGKGFTCWLDIMEVGGGDVLYEKIDQGIRASCIFIACVTRKYLLSSSCRKEVSLADTLKKPIVPLLLENIQWPPDGATKAAFSSIQHIDFCQQNSKCPNIWECPQMEELEHKISSTLGRHVSMSNGTNNKKTDETAQYTINTDKQVSNPSKGAQLYHSKVEENIHKESNKDGTKPKGTPHPNERPGFTTSSHQTPVQNKSHACLLQ